MNYTQLRQAIIDYCSNTESSFVNNIPTFIEQAEIRIFNEVQFPTLRKNVVGVTTPNNKYMACPDDFLAPYSFAVINASGVYSFLLNKDVSFLRSSFPNPALTGVPQYYALFGPQSSNAAELSFILAPTPDAIYSMELHYFYYPETIVTAGNTWLGDNLDNVLLYGSLVEAYTYMKGESDLLALYESKYKEALVQAKRLGDGLERRDAYRSGQYRVDVR